ncbi:32 kDa beta-galactoside-binding lectin lec-3-like [Armigeres subalbatus]|uniref:32 kDa beta-galactoside-binding lectin lec-3-like n=1 Tax=Armigeres subalbatus TaxID=124917 RepID=UPI002ED51881
MATLPIFNPRTPFLGEIPNGLSIGQSMLIQGKIIGNEMFNINLQSGAAVNPRDDTPLHISIRLGDKRIVRNSFVDGAWQKEERDGKCRITVGENFQLQIEVKKSHFKLRIDGKKFCKFKHRLSVDQVRFVHIGNGAVIESITVANV